MIVIFSTKGDKSTTEVCDWLEYLDETFKVVYPEDFYLNIWIDSFSRNSVEEFWRGCIGVPINEVSVFWCRKWNTSNYAVVPNSDDFDVDSYYKLKTASKNELKTLSSFMFSILPSSKVINPFYDTNMSKLNQLMIAQECGLSIPKSYISSKKESLVKLVLDGSSHITKPMDEGFGVQVNGESYTTFTARVESFKADTFLPSLIQQEVTKAYEVRSFVLGKDVFSMAIFSQENRQTKVDFRQYDNKNPNRLAPFQLPSKETEGLFRLFKKIGIQTGSVDLY